MFIKGSRLILLTLDGILSLTFIHKVNEEWVVVEPYSSCGDGGEVDCRERETETNLFLVQRGRRGGR